MRSVFICTLLVILTVAVYWQVGNHEFLGFDDRDYVVNNPYVAAGLTTSNIAWAFTSTHSSNWHPLTWLSHMTDVEFYGMNPGGHHLTNLLIHTATTLLLFFLFFRLTRSPWKSSFVAALFALHPTHVESVAWVAERKDVLCTFFGCLSLLLYAAYLKTRSYKLYCLALLAFVLGLMSKPMLVTLPVIMLLMDFWPLNRFNSTACPPGQKLLRINFSTAYSLIAEKIPFFFCSLVSSAITIYAQGKGGAISSIDVLPVGMRIANAITAYVRYIFKTLWPTDLALFYPFPGFFPIWEIAGSSLALLAITALSIKLSKQKPYLIVGWLWFLITLLPVIGLIQVGEQSIADRYLYIPSIGLFIIAAWGVPELTKKIPFQQAFLVVLTIVTISTMAVLTFHQLTYWQDSISLHRHSLQVTHRNYTEHNNLGAALAEKGLMSEAIQEYQKAIEINPDYELVRNNFGIALVETGMIHEAIQEYEKAIEINPGFRFAHNNLGIALAKTGRLDEAIQEYQKAIEIKPDYSLAYNNLGAAFEEKGLWEEAIKNYQKAIEIMPVFIEAHKNLGQILIDSGRFEEAIQIYAKTIKLAPRDFNALSNLGTALSQTGRLNEAVQALQKAAAIRPESYKVHNDLGIVLARNGNHDKAIKEFKSALEIVPEHLDAQLNLGITFAQAGHFDEAIDMFRKTIAINPDSGFAYFNLGHVLVAKGQRGEAIQAYKRTIELNPGFTAAQISLGQLFAEDGQLEEAIQAYRKSLEINPEDVGVLNHLGVALARKGQLDEAAEAFRTALRLSPEDQNAQNNLKLTLENLKKDRQP